MKKYKESERKQERYGVIVNWHLIEKTVIVNWKKKIITPYGVIVTHTKFEFKHPKLRSYVYL